jgi:hypothetical protein
MIGNALRKMLGGPWQWADNLTFLTCELARHDMSAVDWIFLPSGGKAGPWLTLEAPLPDPSTIWQWNPEIERPV